MAKWARKNENGDIVEITTEDPTGKFHESIVWESVNDSAEIVEDNGIIPENNQDLKDLVASYEEYVASITPQTEE
jgi:hypothetical protein